jgi:Sulfotransferase domain
MLQLSKTTKGIYYSLKHLFGYRDSDSSASLLLRNRQALQATDIILLSYPRSGNTWSRYVIADFILQSLGFETDAKLPIEFHQVIPSIYTHDITTTIDPRIQLPYRLIKSHHHLDVQQRKCIYIFRDPINTLVSYYRFLLNHPDISGALDLFPPDTAIQKPIAEVGVDQFCLDRVDKWMVHLEKAIHRAQVNPTQLCLLCYEQLRKDPEVGWTTAIEFLGLDKGKININQALKNQSLENRVQILKQTGQEAQLAFNVGNAAVDNRHVQIGVSEATQKIIQEKTQALYRQALTLLPPTME